MTIEDEGVISLAQHRDTDFAMLFGSTIHIYLPERAMNQTEWTGRLYPLGSKNLASDQSWTYLGLQNLLENPSFFDSYFLFWQTALMNYQQRNAHPTYWFTNGCGQPIPRPQTWPRRIGIGYESVSDGKTSVGMDRTDDIKKGTYQVLKLSADGKPAYQYAYKTGIISNIHAIRHFDDYLSSLKDIIWTRDSSGCITQADQLPPDTQLFHLFDGIIALTETLARDKWVEKVFGFC